MRRHDLLVGSLYLNPTICTTQADHDANYVIRYELKRGKPDVIDGAAARAGRLMNDERFRHVLRDAGVLVPVPKSSVHAAGSLWVPEILAEAMHEQGIGSEVAPLLERHTAVRKSSVTKSAAERPTAQEHYASMRVKSTMFPPRRVTLVDDVVTIGRTLMASALRIVDAFPGVEVRAFVAARSVRYTHLDEIRQMTRPEVGWYRMRADGWIEHDAPY